MKKIIFITGGLSRGGGERVISILANYYNDKGYDIDILMLLSDEIGYEINNDIEIQSLVNKNRLLKIPYWIIKLRKHFKNNPEAKIISFFGRINALVIIASLFLNMKLIVSERNDPRYDGRNRITNLILRYLYKIPDRVVFQTNEISSLYPKLKNKIVIYNPIKINVDNIERGGDFNKIINIGRLEPQKNQLLLLKAFSRLLKNYPSLKLYIYGEGSLREVIEKYIIENNLSNNVFLEGNIQNIHNEINDTNFLVLSSNFEGLSNALLEAMCMRIPCISTSVAGSNEVIENMRNGIIVPIGDLDKLYEAMKLLYENKDLRNKFKQELYGFSKKFSLEEVMEKWNSLIN